MRPFTKHGFTIIELMVVVSIIATLASLLLPAVFKVRTMARTTQCASNLRTLGIAASGYAGDYEGNFPPSFSNPNSWNWISDKFGGPHGLGFLTRGYLDQSKVLACPDVNLNNSFGNFRSIEAFTQRYTGYRYIGNAFNNDQLDYFINPTNQIRGPAYLPTSYYGVSNPSSSNVVFIYDIIAESTNPKQVFHPHPKNTTARPAAPFPQIRGGNVLYVDCHVRFLIARNWIQNGPYGRYMPWRDL